MRRLARIPSSFVASALLLGACQGAPATEQTGDKSSAASSEAKPSDKAAASSGAAENKPAAASGETAKTEVPAVPSKDVPEASKLAEPSAPAAAPAKSGLMPFAGDKEGMSPMPASALRTKLEAIQKKLDVDKIYDDEATAEQLVATLPQKVGDFLSLGLPDTSAQGASVPGRAVMRGYEKNEVSVHAVIYDAGKAPDARRVFSDYLLLVGNDAQGNQHPYIGKNGAPGMEAYVVNMQMSFATELVGKRYMLVIVARPTDDPNEARKFIEQLDLAPLQ